MSGGFEDNWIVGGLGGKGRKRCVREEGKWKRMEEKLKRARYRSVR